MYACACTCCFIVYVLMPHKVVDSQAAVEAFSSAPLLCLHTWPWDTHAYRRRPACMLDTAWCVGIGPSLMHRAFMSLSVCQAVQGECIRCCQPCWATCLTTNHGHVAAMLAVACQLGMDSNAGITVGVFLCLCCDAVSFGPVVQSVCASRMFCVCGRLPCTLCAAKQAV